MSGSHEATAAQMAVDMARLIQGPDTVFFGVNSALPLVAAALAKARAALSGEGDFDLITVAGGINPTLEQTGRHTTSPKVALGSCSVVDNPEFYGLVARGQIGTGFLGAGQVDRFGNINSSFIGSPASPKVRLPGGGGAAVILPLVRRCIIWRAAHNAKILVDKCNFVTSAGNVDRVVTPLCILRKLDGRLILESISPGVDREMLQERTGFPLANLSSAPESAAPSDEEMELLEKVDPDRIRLTEFTG